MSTPLEIAGPHKRTEIGNNDFYYGGGAEAWASLAEANAGVPSAIRKGKTVGIYVSSQIVEYWWPTVSIADIDLVVKILGASTSNKIVATHATDFTLPYIAGTFLFGFLATPQANIVLRIGSTPGGNEVMDDLQIFEGGGEYTLLNKEYASSFTLYFSGVTAITDFSIRTL